MKILLDYTIYIINIKIILILEFKLSYDELGYQNQVDMTHSKELLIINCLFTNQKIIKLNSLQIISIMLQ